ncbi:MAG: flavin reductase family protein [Phycisphaerales bacterium]
MPEDPVKLDDAALAAALGMLPEGHFLMTSAYDGQRAAVILRSVQRCADEPVLLAVASRKGHAIDPLIRDSRAFAICLIDPADRLLARKFPPAESGPEPGEDEVDPFDSIPTETMVSGSPIVRRCRAAFDCEVVRHFDLEADHELFVGQVMGVKVFRQT